MNAVGAYKFGSNTKNVLLKQSNSSKSSNTLGLYLNDIISINDLSLTTAGLNSHGANSQTASNNISNPNSILVKSAGKIIVNNIDRKMWEVNLGSSIYSFPVVYKDKAYIGCQNGTLHVLNIKDGSISWSYNVKDGNTPQITINDGIVYSLWGTGELISLRADNGEKIWSKKTGTTYLDHDYVRQCPFVSNNIIYVFGSGLPASGFLASGSIDPLAYKEPAKIYALDAKTGKELWNVKIKSWLPGSSPFEFGGRVYFWKSSTDSAGEISALNAKTGEELWTKPFHSFMPNFSEYNKVLFAGDRYGKIHALDGVTGKTLWAKEASTDVCYPTAAGGMVYTGDSHGEISALNASDGSTIWQYPAGKIRFYPVYSKGVVYAGTEDGKIYALDGKDGTKLWEFKTGDSIFGSPCIYKEIVFAGTKSGKVYAVMNDQAYLDKSVNEALQDEVETKDTDLKIELGDGWVIIGTTKIPVQER